MFKYIDNYLKRHAKATIFIISVAFVAVLGIFDHLIGPELSFSVFYTVPILLSTWHGGRTAGLVISSFAAVSWLAADLTAGHQYSAPFIPFWNSLVRLAFFIIITVLLSIVKNKLALEESLADTDYLTNLKNSRAFYEHVEMESNRSRRYKRPFTIAYIDLDNFKYVNDAMGHEVGDSALKTVAETIRSNVRNSDIISRLGGDEFGCLFNETGYEAAEAIIRNIVQH